MTVAVRPPGSSAIVEVADGLVGRYIEQGWTLAEKAKAEPVEPPKVKKRK